MDTIVKISAIKKRMKNKPPAQQLYNFFAEETENIIDVKQMKEVKKIVDVAHEKLTTFLDNAINSAIK